jgi:hypothetical protein
MMLQPASSMGASFHMRMVDISPEDFVSTMTAVCTATAMKKNGVIPRRRLNPAKCECPIYPACTSKIAC